MNATIADLVKAQIGDLEFVDKLAGVVKPITFKQGEETKTFPVAVNDGVPCAPHHYTDLVPDDSKISIIYFEDQGIDVINAGSKYSDCMASLRLVCWCNLKKINPSYNDAVLLKTAVIQTIPKRLDNTGWATKILVLFDGEETKSPEIFSEYSYDETVTQYLIYPFDYFALKYKVRYSIAMDADCLSEVVMNPKIC